MFVRLKRAFLLSACIVAAENGNFFPLGGLQFRLFLLKSAEFLYPVSRLSFRAYPIMLKQREIECYTHRDIIGGHIEITIQRFRSLIT